MRERDEQESVSGAMRGRGEGPGSADLPYPRTDAEDSGVGDGGLGDRGARQARHSREGGSAGPHTGGAADPASAHEATPANEAVDRSGDDVPGRDRQHGGWGDRGIGGGRAGGTGP
jgi:hypothetical protein